MSFAVLCGVTYFGEGVNWVSTTFLKDAASRKGLGEVQKVQNLLPEAGSILWTLKPALCFLVDKYNAPRRYVIAFATLAQAAFWAIAAANGGAVAETLLVLSLASSGIDGLIDGMVCSTGEKGSYFRYVCEVGRSFGSFGVGLFAVLLSLEGPALFAICSLSWLASFVATLMAKKADLPACEKAQLFVRVEPKALVPVALTLVVVMCPRVDLFVFRQRVLGLTAGEQTAVGLSSTLARILGCSIYHWWLAPRAWMVRLRVCFAAWTLPCVLWLLVLRFPAVAYVERFLHEVPSSMLFMLCNITMQDVAASISPTHVSTVFATMQGVGSVGYLLGRNSDYLLMALVGVDPDDLMQTLGPCVYLCCVIRIGLMFFALAIGSRASRLSEHEANKTSV